MKAKPGNWADLLQQAAKMDDPVKQKRLLRKYLDDEQRRALNGATLSQPYRFVEKMDGTVAMVRADGSTLLMFVWSDLESALDEEKFPGARAMVAILRRQASIRVGSSSGGKAAAKAQKEYVQENDAEIQRDARAIRASERGIKQKDLAAILEDRGFGAKSTLLRKIARPRR
jgi:hypothetical protein